MHERKYVEHYRKFKYETVDIAYDWNMDPFTFNAMKYIQRCDYKGQKESDLIKAIDYLKIYTNKLSEDNSRFMGWIQNKITLKEVLDDWKLSDNLLNAIYCLDDGNLRDALFYLKRELSVEVNSKAKKSPYDL